MQKLWNVIMDLVSGVAIVAALALMIAAFQTDMSAAEQAQQVATQDLPASGDTWLAEHKR